MSSATPPQAVVLYSTSVATTANIRGAITNVKHILETLGIAYEEVDLVLNPSRRDAMLAASGGVKSLPQLHVGGKFIGDANTIQELQDCGELKAKLSAAGRS